MIDITHSSSTSMSTSVGSTETNDINIQQREHMLLHLCCRYSSNIALCLATILLNIVVVFKFAVYHIVVKLIYCLVSSSCHISSVSRVAVSTL